MIAANIMDIEGAVLASGDSLARACEVFSGTDAKYLPVLDNGAVVIGVLSGERLLKAVAEAGATVLTVAGLCERAFLSALPGASLLELRERLGRKEGRGGPVFIVDNAGRLLGRVGDAELARRAHEYAERGERP